MNREYHKWYSEQLGRDMELLVFGHAGVPAIVFPSSQARFYEFEERGMVGSIGHKVDNGEIQLYCVDSLDAESWYNRNVPARWRIARQMQYQEYILNELVPLVRQKNQDAHLIAIGCSFGGYHAVNIALRHPDVFTGFLSMSGAFDILKLPARLLRPGCLLQHATALPGEYDRRMVSGSIPAKYLRACYWMGRSVPRAKPASFASARQPCRATSTGNLG